MSTSSSVDVIVVGAGAVGASCAYHLSKSRRSVLVAETFGGPAEGSTGRSFASIRSQWADSLNIEMSWRSVRAYRSFPDDHGIDVGYRPTGYLLLIPDALWQADVAPVDLQRAHGVPVDVLGLTAAARITPFAADGIAGATWGPADGVVDPHLVPGARSRRNIYATAPGALPDPVPMTIDLGTGMFVRSEGPRLLFGAARPDQPDGYDVSVDWPWMESVLTIGADRFPWLADLPLDRSGCWAGTYENTPDRHGILGPHPAAPTWINACGFSGHGLMQAPEIGRLVAEQIETGAITSIDTSALRLARVTPATPTHPR